MHNLLSKKSEDSTFLYSDFYPTSYDISVQDQLDSLIQEFSNNKSNNNIWIAKPTNQSKGIGIEVFNNLQSLLDYTNSMSNTFRFIVQKYIENPHLLQSKK